MTLRRPNLKGEPKPFPGTAEEAEANKATHKMIEVKGKRPHIVPGWFAKQAGYPDEPLIIGEYETICEVCGFGLGSGTDWACGETQVWEESGY